MTQTEYFSVLLKFGRSIKSNECSYYNYDRTETITPSEARKRLKKLGVTLRNIKTHLGYYSTWILLQEADIFIHVGVK